MRVGVIDMGTNSTRLLLADVDGGEITELERVLTTTRLGAHVDRDGRLAETAMGRTRKAVTGYVERAREVNCDVIFASGTSAVRDSANGEAFMQSLARDLGIPARVLSGDEEARATFRGVTSAQPAIGRTAVIDVGGGSTELVVGEGAHVLGAVSLQAGCVRMTERWLGDNDVGPDQLTVAREEIDNLIDRHVAPDLLLPLETDPIAVAGTATTLAAIELGLPGYDSAKIHGQRVRRDAIATWIAKLAPLTAEQRRAAHPAIEIGRAPVIIGGALVLLAMLDALHADAYIASERDILHGLALGLAA
jgi:exopolyphosphatase/guanosine-5'-triphosphate,3'-diphosphate pyrophosphatase